MKVYFHSGGECNRPREIFLCADQATVDVIVVGGGPAGSAAAITAARHGLRVALVEAARFPRFRPGETLAAETRDLIERLIGREAFDGLATLHFPYIRRNPSAGDEEESGDAPAPGFHVHRAQLDAALINAVIKAEVRVLQPACATAITPEGSRCWRVRTTLGDLRGRFVIDASGGTQWLSRALNFDALTLSEPLTVQYQYGSTIAVAPTPIFAINQMGWRWTTALPGGSRLWASMDFPGQSPRSMAKSSGTRAVRRSSGTWRIASQLGASNFALAGDAACHVDPASSHGVLRALASGIAVAEAAGDRLSGQVASDDVMLGYCRSITAWVLNDCRLLHAVYKQATGLMDPVGFAERSQIFFTSEDDHGA